MPIPRDKNTLFWIVAAISTLLDRASKIWVVQTFDLSESIPIVEGVFHFTYVTNSGAAFSLFSGSEWLKWLSLLVSLVLMALAIFGPRLGGWEQIGYGFILGGALGNGIDRFLQGEVIDFLDFCWINFPVFNLADVSINIGMVCLIVVFAREQ
ncbi:MAG: lipoprotein signal peptidase [Cyanobacteria bacterium SID2]|nr:lipoprotein signal peptidase [Cyanobacteria bacterium SID2]MBP0003421.1 lipoprotein signal peptidase [Cyanobacteria bacterium SBC]